MSPLDRWTRAYAAARAHGGLTMAACAVLVRIEYRDGQGAGAWESLAEIAAATGGSVRTVRRALRALEADGLITGERRPGKTTVYRVRYPGHSDRGTPATVTAHPGHSDRRTGREQDLEPGPLRTGDKGKGPRRGPTKDPAREHEAFIREYDYGERP